MLRKLIFTRKVVHLASFWKWGFLALESGQFLQFFIYSYISVVRVLQFPPEGWLRMSIGHCGITWVTIRPNGRVSLKCMGDTGHIAPENLSSWMEKYMFTKQWIMSCMLYAGNLYFMDTIHYLIYTINLSFNAKLIHYRINITLFLSPVFSSLNNTEKTRE